MAMLTVSLMAFLLVASHASVLERHQKVHKRSHEQDDTWGEGSVNKVAVEVLKGYNQVNQGNMDKPNMIFSPESLYEQMNLMYCGAEEGSQTQDQLAKFLGKTREASGETDNAQQIKSAKNPASSSGVSQIRLFLERGEILKPEYIRRISQYYQYDNISVDFGSEEGNRVAKYLVNLFGDEITEGKILESLKQAVPQNTRYCSVQAAYYQNQWKYPFESQQNTEIQFNNGYGSSISVEGMANEKFVHTYQDQRLKLVGLPLRKSGHIMYFVLPREADGLSQAIQHITLQKIQEVTRKAYKNGKQVNYRIPKMHFAAKVHSLKPVLEKLNLSAVFDEDRTNLNQILNENLHVNDFLHTIYLKTSEQGVTAATTCVLDGTPAYAHQSRHGVQYERQTDLYTGRRSMRNADDVSEEQQQSSAEEYKGVFNVDHPFMFYIYEVKDQTTGQGEIQWIAAVNNPLGHSRSQQQ